MEQKQPINETRSALVIGATGLVGSHCLDHLLESSLYHQVSVVVRRPIPKDHPKLKQNVIDFQKLDSYETLFEVNDVFCCLGVKGPVSQYEFNQVETGYPLTAGKMAAKTGVDQFLVVTAMLSSPRSPVQLFKAKGILEAGLKKESLNALHLFRPSLIVGDRDISRPDEESIALFFKRITIFTPFLRKYLYIEGKSIAGAMVHVAQKKQKGLHIYNVNKIHRESILE